MSKNKSIRSFMRNFTSFGDAYIALVVVAFGSRDIDVVLRVLLGLLLIYLLGNVIRTILFRERPEKNFIKGIFSKVESGSFPSLHVARSSFAYSYLFEYLDFPFIVLPIFLVVIVGASRVYLKKHYIVDTFFGLFFGLSIFYLFKVIF